MVDSLPRHQCRGLVHLAPPRPPARDLARRLRDDWTMAPPDEIDRLRAEVEEWRRRAEVAEAVAAERLARAETAERALRAAEAALTRSGRPEAAGGRAGEEKRVDPHPPQERRPASLLERWRRYTETIN